MKKMLWNLILLFAATAAFAQGKYFTKEAKITFLSDAPMEKIKGVNSKATSVLDSKTGNVEFALLVKAFQFDKKLMQEHFNENYLESDKFPKANFKGQVERVESIDFSKDGTYKVKITGDLTMHGVTKKMTTDGEVTIKKGIVSATSAFKVLLADYKIEIPALVKDKVAKEVKINVAANYSPLKS